VRESWSHVLEGTMVTPVPLVVQQVDMLLIDRKDVHNVKHQGISSNVLESRLQD
jgi:hypothetical protein